jgi:hypothetical protein
VTSSSSSTAWATKFSNALLSIREPEKPPRYYISIIIGKGEGNSGGTDQFLSLLLLLSGGSTTSLCKRGN